MKTLGSIQSTMGIVIGRECAYASISAFPEIGTDRLEALHEHSHA